MNRFILAVACTAVLIANVTSASAGPANSSKATSAQSAAQSGSNAATWSSGTGIVRDHRSRNNCGR